MYRPASLLLFLMFACNGPSPTDTTDDAADTDLDDTHDTDLADTDVADTDIADTDAADTDPQDTDPPCPDADGDSVCDAVDQCVGDDATGDSDLDLTCNDQDLCDGEDAFGDNDMDRVCDNTDLCEGDNATGDADTDGVCGDRDLCTGGDAWGDTDNDGVCGDIDACVGDDSLGDSDLDGSCDDQDLCTGDDRTGDSDADGTCADGDLCPGGPEDDLDFSGYPDACEPVELTRVVFNESGFGTTLGQFLYTTLVIELPSSCASGSPLVGGAVYLADGVTGTYTIEASVEPHFDTLGACMTNGADDTLTFWAAFSSGSGQASPSVGFSRAESQIGGSPDFAGYTLSHIDIVVTRNDINLGTPGRTSATFAGEWVFYGYPNP